MKKLLEVKNVTKIYKMYHSNIDRLKEIFLKKTYHKEFVANKEISFDLFEKETLGIIGVNGAGKSTILKIIAGVIVPTSGEVIRHGRVTALLELGTGFNEEMTGRQNILLNATLLGMTHKECYEKEEAIIEFSEIGEYIDEPIKTYSSGMKMRLAFSIALFSEPQILIVDEALSVGDAHFGAKCTRALKERKEKNMAIIYVSHDLNSLKLLCDRVVLLNHGTIVKEGDPEDVINSYNFFIAKRNDKEEKLKLDTNKKAAFGTFDATITKVTLTTQRAETTLIHSGENVVIAVHIEAKKRQENMTVGILIKDKFGQDIFGTNTFYHKISCNFEANKHYLCNFAMPLNIGTGKYTITAAIHPNDTHLQQCSHWLDYALDFEVTTTPENYFIGLCRLEPKITLQNI